jgi:hypothetical protein
MQTLLLTLKRITNLLPQSSMTLKLSLISLLVLSRKMVIPNSGVAGAKRKKLLVLVASKTIQKKTLVTPTMVNGISPVIKVSMANQQLFVLLVTILSQLLPI